MGLTTPHEMPRSSRLLADSTAALADLPRAKIATSLPSLTTTPLPIGSSLRSSSRGVAYGGAARDADGEGAIVLIGRVDEVLQLVFVHGGRNDGVGETPQVGDVEGAVVRLAVLSDDARAIGDEFHRKVLQTDIVNDLVERALEEGRVDGDEGVESVGGHSGPPC